MALSDAWLKANQGKPRDKLLVRADRDGLSVRVSPKGKMVFQLRYRYAGQAKRMDLGSYPLMGLKEARDEADRLRKHLELGHDPKTVVAVERQYIEKAFTFHDLFSKWYVGYCMKNKADPPQHLRSFELHVFPRLGHLPADKITMHEWLDLLEKLVKDRPAIAERVLTDARQAYRWGNRRQFTSTQPLADIHPKTDLHIVKGVRERSLSDAEVAVVWDGIMNSNIRPKNRLFLKLCLIYGCRCGELRVMERGHLDFEQGIWTVPPENHKIGRLTKKPLLRPIWEETEELFHQAMSLSGSDRWVFTGYDMDKPVGQRAHLSLPVNLRHWIKRRRGIEMASWSIHDLRRTARTNFSTLAAPHVAEIMLGHKLPGQWQVYDQYHYLPEQLEAYVAWCERLKRLTGTGTLV